MFNFLARALTPTPVATSPAPTPYLIELTNVVKRYQTPAGAFTALRNINLTIAPGEFVAVIGKSGSGKSTLINMVTGIDRPTLGQVHVAGASLTTLNERQLARWRGLHIGVVFQFFQLLPTLSLIENVMLPMEFCNRYAPKERIERATHLLEMVGLVEQAHKFPAAVSGGQQQRVAIARALANDPDILIADEPTGSLDSKTADSIFQLFEEFVQMGRTILMVTHDRNLASRVSRVVYIADGALADEVVTEALPSLNESQQVQLLANLEPETYQPGDTIIQQGDPAESFYIITRGTVDVVIDHPDGELLVNQLTVGDYFGEMGILEGGTRLATVRAAQGDLVTVMQLDGRLFAKLQAESNMTRDQISHAMRQRAREVHLSKALPSLSKPLMKALADSLQTDHFEAGTIIFQAGDPSDKFYIIEKGEVELLEEKEAGTGTVIGRLQPGQYFGEIGMLSGRQRTRTIRASQATPFVELTAIHRTAFFKLINDSHLTRDEIVQMAQRRQKAGDDTELIMAHFKSEGEKDAVL